jgi:uncharacterized phage infection (PIP) family protein YhgE
MDFEQLQEIEIFKGTTLADVLETVFEHALEERNESLSAFRDFREMIKESDDLFMLGDKPDKYIKIAQESTDSMIRMIQAAKQCLDLVNQSSGDKEENYKVEDLHELLDSKGVGPKRFNRIAQMEEEAQEKAEEVAEQKKLAEDEIINDDKIVPGTFGKEIGNG